MCDHEKEYFLHQQRAQNMIEDDQMFMGGNRLNEHGFEMPTLPDVTYDMMSDDNFMVRKLDEIIVGCEARVHMNHIHNESNVEIGMLNRKIWSGTQLPLNIEERWRWLVSHYEIEHTLWMYPEHYFVGNDKQPGIMGHNVDEHDEHLVPLSMEELCNLEQIYSPHDSYVCEINNRLKSVLWKVGGENNPIEGSQAPLLSDVGLHMLCLQCIQHVLYTSNMYRIDDKKDKSNYLDPDWELTICELVHEMCEQYRNEGINIPRCIVDKLASFHMSLGTYSHRNYAMIDDLISEALHRLCLPAIVAGGFAARRLGHTIRRNHVDIFTYVPPWFDESTLPWRFGPCFPNVHSQTHIPQGLGWPPSSHESNDPPNVSWSVKYHPVNEYSILNMMSHCDFAHAIQMCVVQCVISHPGYPQNALVFHQYEKPFVFKFILLKARSVDQCLEMYEHTSMMIHNIVNGFDIDPCKCFGVKWKHPVHEMPCVLKHENSDDMIYMRISDMGVWPTQEHFVTWDPIWSSVKDGIERYTYVYNMCIKGKVPWAVYQAAAYVHVYNLSSNKDQTEIERVKNIRVLCHGITCLDDMLRKYLSRTEIIIQRGLLDMRLNPRTIHEANVLLMKMCINHLNIGIR